MGARLIRDGEAVWREVAFKWLPPSLTWAGFCREMGWPGSCPTYARKGDNHRLDFYLKAAEVLGVDPAGFLAEVVGEMMKRCGPLGDGVSEERFVPRLMERKGV
jgi:hypothetical protein